MGFAASTASLNCAAARGSLRASSIRARIRSFSAGYWRRSPARASARLSTSACSCHSHSNARSSTQTESSIRRSAMATQIFVPIDLGSPIRRIDSSSLSPPARWRPRFPICKGFELTPELRQARIDDDLGIGVQRDSRSGKVISFGHAGSEMGYSANVQYSSCTGAVWRS
jgi:hypothetical protein